MSSVPRWEMGHWVGRDPTRSSRERARPWEAFGPMTRFRRPLALLTLLLALFVLPAASESGADDVALSAGQAVVLGQCETDPFSVRPGLRSQVHRHVEDTAAEAPDELGLAVRFALQVHPAQRALARVP